MSKLDSGCRLEGLVFEETVGNAVCTLMRQGCLSSPEESKEAVQGVRGGRLLVLIHCLLDRLYPKASEFQGTRYGPSWA